MGVVTVEGCLMRILVSGATGLTGSAVCGHFSGEGHEVWRLVRRVGSGAREVTWDPGTGHVERAGLDGFDVMVHLAGENIATGRWTVDKKARIRYSRVHGTALLCNELQEVAHPPKVLLSASAVGYYGDRGGEVLTESSGGGQDFLAGVCREWEAATWPAAESGVRVVHLRFGLVLSREGGLLARMSGPFRWGLGGTLGAGGQYMSWVTAGDVAGAIGFLAGRDDIVGAVNVTAPEPVTNREFTRALGHALRRPAFMRVPRMALKLAFGELGDSILASQRAVPERLMLAGYEFKQPNLAGALAELVRQ